MTARRYEISHRVLKNISRMSAANEVNIFQHERITLFYHNNGDLFTHEDNMLFSLVKI